MKKNLIFLVFLLVLTPHIVSSDDKLISLRGDYLAYSYDHNQIYGEGVEFKLLSYDISCKYIKIDIFSRSFYAYGGVILKKEDEILHGDELLFSPHENRGTLVSYRETVEVKELGDKEKGSLFPKNKVLDSISFAEIQKSFIYFSGLSMDITSDFDVYGYNVTIYLEGLESVGFKKFKLSEGIRQGKNGFFINKIWYNRRQGIIGRASYIYEKENEVNSLTQINYEEHSVLKGYQGSQRQVDIMSSTSINLTKNLNLGITGNYNSSSLWNTRFILNKNWTDKNHTQVDFSYNKPINLKGEAWLGVASFIDTGKFGSISFSGRYEIQNQVLTEFSYEKFFHEKVRFSMDSSYFKLKIGGSEDYSKIFTGGLNLSYTTRVFDLSTNYYLNHDLFGNQLLSQPQLSVGLNPFDFFEGLLSASLTNVFIYNKLRMEDVHTHSFSNNMAFNLAARPIFIRPSLSVDFNIALEQFIEKEGRNFTSGGLIINAKKNITEGISLEGFYSMQSRRRTKAWLIEGTTSQDLSTVFRVNPSESLNGWISFSYDPKTSQWKQSFADVSFGIIKGWKFHSLLNYDFLFKKINNIDLYLIRDAGRFQIRFIWRSLSKQILIELVPK